MDKFVTNIWAKNSAASYVGSKIQKAIAMLSENVDSDIETYSSVLTDVITRVGLTSIIPFISATIPGKTSSGKVPIIFSKFGGKNGKTTSTSIVKVLQVLDSSTFSVDGDITSSGTGVGKVLYVEPQQILVLVTAGSFIVGETVDNAATYATAETTIQYIFSDVVGVQKMFVNYSGAYSTAAAEALTKSTTNEIKINAIFASYVAKERKIMTDITLEFLQDIKAMYGVDGLDKIKTILAAAIEQEIQQEHYEYLKTIATQKPDLILHNSLGTQSGLTDIFKDIISSINRSIGIISTEVNMTGEFFVIGSSAVCAAIQLATTVVEKQEYKTLNSQYVGHMVATNAMLINDNFALEDYVLIGCAGPKGMNNSGVIFVPVSTDFVVATDPSTLEDVVGILNRYAFIRSSLDTKYDTTGASDFYHMQVVDFSGLPNYF
jgi:hypothetical protein